MPIGTCRLCGIQADLQLSHVIPAVIYRWMRDTSGNSYLRFGAQPNKRAQDGNKFYWLCQSCEARLSRCEDIFARRIFHPYIKDSGLRMRYGPWLLQFGASLVWRVLKWHEEQGLAGYPEDKRPFLFAAEKVWREFLLGSTRNPGAFEVHLLPVEGLEKGSHADFWPPTINRYFMRTIDTDVAHGRSLVLVCAKIPRFIFLGFGRLDHPRDWVGTKIQATEGMFEPRRFVVPQLFAHFMKERAKRMDKVHGSMSARQRQKIDESIVANVDKLRGSDLLSAMQRDVEMFGDQAFLDNRLTAEKP